MTEFKNTLFKEKFVTLERFVTVLDTKSKRIFGKILFISLFTV